MAIEIWVNISSGNGLLPDGTKPLPEPMLTFHNLTPVTFISGLFHKRCLNHQSLKSIWKLHLKFYWNSPGAGQWVNKHANINDIVSVEKEVIITFVNSLSFQCQIYVIQSSFVIQWFFFTPLCERPVASFTKEVNPWLAKCPLKTNGHLSNLELTSLVKEATGVPPV